MPPAPQITVEQIDFGRFPVAASLNPRIHATWPLLRVTLAVRWDDREAAATLARVEKSLESFSPSFRRHQCRGPSSYHVFSGNGRGRAKTAAPTAEFEGGLALAHLIEHMVIDFECSVTDLRSCSGVTAALRRTPGLYHMFIETPERGVGRFCLALALRTIQSQLAGRPPGHAEREALASARLAFRHPLHRLTAPGVARALAWPESTAERALRLLRDLGYLSEEPYAVNLSGVPAYRVNGWQRTPAAAVAG